MRSAAQTQPEMRDRILGEAERVFRAFGYAKTTVADIAKACGMSPANVYRFFESKSAINEAITGVVLRRMESLGMGIAAEPRPAAERLRRLIVEMHRFTCEQCLHESRVHEIVRKAMDEQWGVIDAHIQRMRLLYRALIEDGITLGEFAPGGIEARAACVFNAALPFCHPQVVAEKFAGDGGVQAAQMADFLVEALRRPHS
ncbi:MAG: TetR family transcriptional regulator [Nevskia sp.]|nr:TetR family transcriptional regulator [Nevskia sp.]